MGGYFLYYMSLVVSEIFRTNILMLLYKTNGTGCPNLLLATASTMFHPGIIPKEKKVLQTKYRKNSNPKFPKKIKNFIFLYNQRLRPYSTLGALQVVGVSIRLLHFLLVLRRNGKNKFGDFLLFAISLGRVVVTSPKIVIKLSRRSYFVKENHIGYKW